ncbi:MAG: Rho termination factor N-terminal domain-containing protein [Cyclobacteriaceae bacterium]
MANQKYEEKYTKPDLREDLKEKIKNSDKGGKKGQWSARKSQLLVKEYEKKGGDYKKDKKDEAAKSLESWTEQDWQTIEGEGEARQDGKTKRYLPKKVWNKLSDKEKREAERTKQKASKEGKQFVPWTNAIKRAFEEANLSTSGEIEEDETKDKETLYNKARQLDIKGRSQMNKQELQKAIEQHDSDSLDSLSKDELYDKAKELQIEGRSKMSKKELIRAIDKQS